MTDRNIILHVIQPDGREAYVERVGEVYVIGGELSPREALVCLAKQADRRAAMVAEHRGEVVREDDGA